MFDTLFEEIAPHHHMEYVAILIKRIEKLCRARKYSINKPTSISDVKQSTLDNIMRGITKNPGIQTMHKLALAFKMTLAEFLDFEELNRFFLSKMTATMSHNIKSSRNRWLREGFML